MPQLQGNASLSTTRNLEQDQAHQGADGWLGERDGTGRGVGGSGGGQTGQERRTKVERRYNMSPNLWLKKKKKEKETLWEKSVKCACCDTSFGSLGEFIENNPALQDPDNSARF